MRSIASRHQVAVIRFRRDVIALRETSLIAHTIGCAGVEQWVHSRRGNGPLEPRLVRLNIAYL